MPHPSSLPFVAAPCSSGIHCGPVAKLDPTGPAKFFVRYTLLQPALTRLSYKFSPIAYWVSCAYNMHGASLLLRLLFYALVPRIHPSPDRRRTLLGRSGVYNACNLGPTSAHSTPHGALPGILPNTVQTKCTCMVQRARARSICTSVVVDNECKWRAYGEYNASPQGLRLGFDFYRIECLFCCKPDSCYPTYPLCLHSIERPFELTVMVTDPIAAYLLADSLTVADQLADYHHRFDHRCFYTM
ncbi:hypothetical protein PENSPDRAFT_657050 [Peniophora sp. CONT]|nr:hypothetical protein PENSPDRAFT_657050 [Peniophora sp. CONT]